jgi:fibronectin-binding autotransporter adhesin
VNASGDITSPAGTGAIRVFAVNGLATANVTDGTILATGFGQHGIDIGSTGTGGVSVSQTGGAIRTSATPIVGNGINATSIGTSGDVTVSASNVEASGRGVFAMIMNGASTGDVSVTALAGGTIEGGLTARNAGSGSSTVVIQDGATVNGNSPGSESVTAGGDATQTIGNNATVTGSSGVVADQTSAAGAGNVTVTVGTDSTITGDGSDAGDIYNGNGIFAGNQGTGTTSVTVGTGTTVTGDANGIFAAQTNAANANDIIVDVQGSVSGDGNTAFALAPYATQFAGAGLPTTGLGIGVSNAGTGAINITTGAGTIDGSNIGISALGSTGNIAIVTGAGAVTGGTDGIRTETGGAGTVAVTTGGNVTGTAGTGITTVAATGSTTITIGAGTTTEGQGSTGVRADSTEGDITVDGGGSVIGATQGLLLSSLGVAGGDITVDGLAVVEGANGPGMSLVTNGGTISVANVGTVSGTGGNGMFLDSRGGDISVQGNGTVGGITGTNGSGINATAGGGNINIGDTAANGAIVGSVDGITANTSGTGNVTIVTADTVEGTAGSGISVVNNLATSGDINVTAGGAITAGNAGNVTVTTTAGGTIDARFGIDAENFGSGDTTVTVGDTINATTGNGVFASAFGGGNVDLSGNGAITSTANFGVVLRASGGAGTIIANYAGDVSGTVGIDSQNTGTGATTITTTGVVTGTTGAGITTAAVDGLTTINVGNDVDGATVGVDANGTGTGTLDINQTAGTITAGTIGIDADQTAGGAIDIDVTGGAINGTTQAITANATTGTVNIDVAGASVGTVSGTVIEANTTTGDIVVNNAADLTSTGGIGIFAEINDVFAVSDAAVTTSGAVSGQTGGLVVFNAGQGNVTVVANGDVTTTTGNAIRADGNGNGTVSVSGTGEITSIDGTAIFARSIGGDVTVTPGSTVTGGTDGIVATSTGGAVIVETSDDVEGTAGDGIRVSSGTTTTLTVNAGDTVTGGANAIVTAGGTFTGTNDGTITTAAGNAINATGGTATFTNNVAAVGMIASSAGTTLDIINNGTWTLLTDGASTLAGTDSFDNTATGVFNANGNTTLTGLETFNNQAGAIVNINGVGGAAGSMNFAGATAFSNAGTIDMQNGVLADNLVVAGDFVGNGGVLNFDLDLTANNGGGEQLSDFLTVGGIFSGTTTVNFALQPGQLALQDNPILVIDTGTTAAGTMVNANGLPLGGLILYDLQQIGEDWFVTSALNLAGPGGIAGNISLVQSIIGSVVNRPSSPFVSGLVQPEPNEERKGFWMRGVGGTAKGSSTAFDVAAVSPASRSTVELDYLGAQAGFDSGRYNIGDKGLEIAVGVTAGYNFGNSRQDLSANLSGITTAEFDSRFAGAYVSAFKGRLFADLQVRFDQTDFTFTNATLGLNDAKTNSTRGSLIGSVGYGFTFGDFQFVPSVGMSLSTTRTDRVTFTDGAGNPTATLDPMNYASYLGFASATVARQFLLPDEVSAITPFVTAAVYNDFGDNPTSLFTDLNSLATVMIQSENLKTYGELSLGVNYLRLFEENLRQLDAGIRADFKFGRQLEAVGVTAQMRLVF